MRKSKYTKELLQKEAYEVESISGLLKKLGLEISGGSHRFIKSKLVLHEIDTKHFTGQLWSKGKKLGENFYKTQRPLDDILKKNTVYPSCRLKHRLYKAGLKKEVCELCQLTNWRNYKLPLELHHKNGDPNDNELKNLQILCPNCHSTIDTEQQNTKVSG
jgi:hypothetical protein